MICPHCGKAISFFVPEETKAKILELREEGYSLRDIQELTGVSFSNVGRIVRQNKPTKRKRKK